MQRDLISITDLTRVEMEYLFRLADEMQGYQAQGERVNFTTMAACFFEPSTRTYESFRVAWHNLGGSQVIGFRDPGGSSVAKGESLADTARIYSCFVRQAGGGLIVIRHPEVGSAQIVADYADVPVINGGDGINEHPTQTLLDLYTIQQYKETLDGLTIGIMGDLKHGRTVHSLMLALNQFDDITIFLGAPSKLYPDQNFLKQIKHEIHLGLSGIYSFLDVLYVTRVQKERFARPEDYVEVRESYQVNPDLMSQCQDDLILMHPLPRVDEISPEVDHDPRAVYFKQFANGVPVRMALMSAILNETL